MYRIDQKRALLNLSLAPTYYTEARGDVMDFGAAITAHSNWKQVLQTYIRRPDHSVDADLLAKDDLCELGEWLSSREVAQMPSSPELIELIRLHRAFHKEAAGIVRKVDLGYNLSTEVALGANSEFSRCSTGIVRCLMAIQRRVA